MSDKMRWRYGDTNPVVAANDSTTVIEISDLVWQNADDAKPASMIPRPDREFSNMSFAKLMQERFANNFLGVAMQRSRDGDTSPIRVATTGVFEFDCPSGTFELGDLVGVGPDEVDGCPLLDQQVGKVATSHLAIGRVARREASAATSVLVDIRSRVMTGGV